MKKFYDIEIDSQVELENGKTLGKLEESKISVNDGNCGSGGWPSDLPKPSVGGFGYTEQGEQTVIVDNETVTTVDDDDIILGLFTTPFNIVDGAYTVIFNGTEYNLNSTFDGDGIDRWYLGDNYDDFSQYPFRIVPFRTPIGYEVTLYTESAGDYEVTVKTKSETIHKIDEKYLPASGGAMVVEFTFKNNLIESATKTVEEVKNAMTVMPVVGVIKTSRSIFPIGCATINQSGDPVFINYDTVNRAWVLQIYVKNGEWKAYVHNS